MNIPYIATQAVSSKKDMSSASKSFNSNYRYLGKRTYPSTCADAIMLFFHSIGGTLGIPVGQSVFMGTLDKALRSKAPQVNVASIIEAGPTRLRDVASPDQLRGVLQAYNAAVVNAFILTVATAGAAFCVSLFLEWKSVKRTEKTTEAPA